MLFILVSEALSLLVVKAIDCGLLEGCRVESNGPLISLLQCANDSLFFFCKAEENQVRALRCILLHFEVAFGLKVNLQKSKMMGVGSVMDLQRLAHLFGCEVSNLPDIYLRLPLGARYKSKSVWAPVLERV